MPCGTLAAAVSVSSACRIEATPDSVWRHERVLERLMQDHTVLPLRFGTICRDADTLRACLRVSADGLLNDLGRVRGKVEIALRIMEDDRYAEVPGERLERDRVQLTNPQTGNAVPRLLGAPNDDEPAGRGAAYLRAGLRRLHAEMAREDSGKRLARLLQRHLDAVSNDVICTAPADEASGFLVSCLVERDRLAAFADALDCFRVEHPQFDVTCTGPWAPYSFVVPPPVLGVAP